MSMANLTPFLYACPCGRIRYVLPLAFELVKEAKSDVKDANTRLLRSLHANLGTAMLQSMYRQSTSQQEKITSILGISNFAKH